MKKKLARAADTAPIIDLAAERSWHTIEAAEREHRSLVDRVIREHPRNATISSLVWLTGHLRDLWRALDAGENVVDRVAALQRASLGGSDTDDARACIETGLRHGHLPDDPMLLTLGPAGYEPSLHELRILALGMFLAGIERSQPAAAKRLLDQLDPSERAQDPFRRHEQRRSECGDAVLRAIQACRRGRGRPRRGEAAGDKWAAIATVIKLAGLGSGDSRSFEESARRRRARRAQK